MEHRTVQEWLGRPEYVGMEIVDFDRAVFNENIFRTKFTEDYFKHFLQYCKVQWSFSKL